MFADVRKKTRNLADGPSLSNFVRKETTNSTFQTQTDNVPYLPNNIKEGSHKGNKMITLTFLSMDI